MRAMVFRGGKPGEMVNLIGEYPVEEIGELLGGQADEEMIQLNRRMAAVLRADREKLPERYAVTYLGAPLRVKGDMVVVHRAMGGELLRDMTAGDGFEAQGLVTAVEEGK